MNLTISSITTTCILHSLLILIICNFLKTEKVIRSIGPNCIIGILLLSIVRLFIPLEFPWTKSIWIENLLMPIRRILIHQFLIGGFHATIWSILLMLWAVVALCIILFRNRTYKKIIACISLLPREQWSVFLKKYDLDVEKYKGIEKVDLVCCQQFESPCLIGLRKTVLILPKLSYKEEELKYIILHELMHVYKKDILLKLFVELLCTMFWWNPILWYLKEEFFHFIEIRNDMQIISRLSEKEKILYMECLKDTALDFKKKEHTYGVAFSRGNFKDLKRRLKLISVGSNYKFGQQIVVCIIIGILIFFNSAIVFEPYSLDKVDEGEVLTDENMFLVADGEVYLVYVNGRYAMTTENLNLFQNIKVYHNLKEALSDE